MAFNWQTFRIRGLSAIAFLAVMLAGLLISHWSFLLLFSVIHFGCWVEYQRLINKIDPAYRSISNFHRIGVMIAGWSLFFLFLPVKLRAELPWLTGWQPWLTTGTVATLFTGLLLVREKAKLVAHSILGVIYISLSLSLMIDLFNVPFNNPALHTDKFYFDQVMLPVFIIGCMWVNDTMAYIVGSLIGRTPLSPISPKKTWEGSVGGVVLVSSLMGYLGFYFDEHFRFGASLATWIMLALVASIAGVIGDLFESKLKRLAGVKDSGRIMPGHGGFLDRFDSLLFAIPFSWIYFQFVMR